ncbi:MAG TPA: succinate--CoA ligase subunit beta, partial [Bacteroidetes bacterium]|nr:succinate--CoA ligase subunit beta [Bacteroidota bacterium]
MNIHEYQAKEILKSYGVAIQEGIVIDKKEDALAAGAKLREQTGTDWMVVKAQIHAGGRGKGGGVKLAKNDEQLQQVVNDILGMTLVTPQTSAAGKFVSKVLL